MKAHGLVKRDGKRDAYRLTDKGNKVALLFVPFHKCVAGPPASSLFNTNAPQPHFPPPIKIETAYRRVDKSIQHILDVLAD